jgi:hypothetical protein
MDKTFVYKQTMIQKFKYSNMTYKVYFKIGMERQMKSWKSNKWGQDRLVIIAWSEVEALYLQYSLHYTGSYTTPDLKKETDLFRTVCDSNDAL